MEPIHSPNPTLQFGKSYPEDGISRTNTGEAFGFLSNLINTEEQKNPYPHCKLQSAGWKGEKDFISVGRHNWPYEKYCTTRPSVQGPEPFTPFLRSPGRISRSGEGSSAGPAPSSISLARRRRSTPAPSRWPPRRLRRRGPPLPTPLRAAAPRASEEGARADQSPGRERATAGAGAATTSGRTWSWRARGTTDREWKE